jgi:ABC-2 type transport system permease protein
MGLTLSELRLRRLSLVVWSGSVLLLVAVIVAVYPSVRDSPDLNSIYGDLSPTVQGLLGGSELTSSTGYLNTQVFAFFLPVVLLVFALGRGAGALAGEEEDRTLDLLLAQPLARWSAYVAKGAAVAVGVAALTVSTWIPLAALNRAVELDLSQTRIIAVCVQMGLFAVALAAGAQAVGAWTGRRVFALSAAAAYAFVSYLVYGLAGSIEWLRPVRPLSLWWWYLGNDPLTNGLSVVGCVVLVGVCFALTALGILAFQRRDLHA